jgi:hypothetical protein
MENVKGREHLGDLRINRKIILKINLKETVCQMDSTALAYSVGGIL